MLLPFATALEAADEYMTRQISIENLQRIVALVPDSWLAQDRYFDTPQAYRDAYLTYLTRRLEHHRAFLEEAIRARA